LDSTYYNVSYMEKIVGKVILSREGLYYKFQCQTQIPGLRLFIKTNLGDFDLGICVPTEGGFGVCTKKPLKSISGEVQSFYFRSQKEKNHGHLIKPNEPFALLHKLSEGHLFIENGNYYFRFNQP